MGVDYLVDQECAPKHVLGVGQMVDLIKSRNRAESLLRMMRERGDTRPLEQITIETVLMRPDGEQRVKTNLSDMFAQSAPLQRHSSHCEGCTANVRFGPFGCYGYVNYPLRARAEKWLLERLPESLNSTAGILLNRAVKDLGCDGSYARGLRSRGQTFFEREQPMTVRYGQSADAFAINSDQAFDLLFGVGNPQPSHSWMVLLFFGVIPHDISPTVFQNLLTSQTRGAAVAQWARPGLQSLIDNDPDVGGLAGYFLTLLNAASQGKKVLVDG